MFNPFQRFVMAILVLLLFLVGGQLTAHWIKAAETEKPKDTFTVGLIDDTPPFSFYSEDNQLVGINIDTVTEIARRMGKKVHIESVSFNRLISGLRTHQYDMVSIGSITPKRGKVVRYVTPHLFTADVLIVHPKLAGVQSIENFHNNPWHIGVYNGTSYIQMLKDRHFDGNMVIYPNQRDVFLAFYKHRVDAIIMNEDVARYIQSQLDPSMIIVPERVRTDRKYAFAVNKDDLKTWRKVNDTVAEMMADGTIDRIHETWMKTGQKGDS